MELRKEYEAIRAKADERLMESISVKDARDIVRRMAEGCQELADRPPKKLTDAEIEKIIVDTRAQSMQGTCRAIEAAAHSKQREPATVTVEVRLYRTNSGQTNCVSQVDASLDANFPFGNPTYKWIGDAFEITREVA